MKAKWILFVVCGLMVSWACSAALADLSSNDQQDVRVQVEKNVSVAKGRAVEITKIQTGPFDVGVEFTVAANIERLNFHVIASYLYKGNVPTGLEGNFIPVDVDRLITIVGSKCNPTDGSTAQAWASITPADSDPQAKLATVAEEYESSESFVFNKQLLTVTVPYIQNDNQLPDGWYQGTVKLVAEIL